jgi:hypothetical protein
MQFSEILGQEHKNHPKVPIWVESRTHNCLLVLKEGTFLCMIYAQYFCGNQNGENSGTNQLVI